MATEAPQSSGKRIAKNTAFLYLRMFIMLAVGLYTARIVLEALGETDYGIYNIIGGVVVLFSFINQALTAATQRFLNFHLGKNEHGRVQKVFCMSMNSYIILSAIFLILAETIGLWFVNAKLNIPPDRMNAANWVYQITVISFILKLLRIPYNASIISYEKMDFFAYISLGEVFLKLGVTYLIFIASTDKLILYAALYAGVELLTNIAYRIYSRMKFKTAHYRLMWDKKIFVKLFSFSGWSLFGSMANMLAHQGLNILINLFFGVIANAAVGVANQVTSHVTQFVSNFQIAFQPQIIKTYAAGEIENLKNLINRTSKLSYFLMFVVSFPLLLTTQSVMEIWLTEVPPYTSIFCQLILGFMLIEAISAPLWMTVQATGQIRNYQILMALCIFSNFPLTYIAFKIGMPVYTTWIIRIAINIMTFVVRCIYMKKKLGFDVMFYVKKTIIPILAITIFSLPIPILLLVFMPSSIFKTLTLIAVALVVSILNIYKYGLTPDERILVTSLIQTKILRKKPA